MFEIGWSEIMVIAIVLIVVVGPKDLPRMLRAFGKMTSKFRTTAGEFRRQFDEALKEAELEDVKKIVDDARGLDPRANLRKALDPVRTIGQEIRTSLKDATSVPAAQVETSVQELEAAMSGPVTAPAVEAVPEEKTAVQTAAKGSAEPIKSRAGSATPKAAKSVKASASSTKAAKPASSKQTNTKKPVAPKRAASKENEA
ncbi:MAG: Sec-independent protein translocase protein TatB [Phyllobacterium sp.]